MKKKSVDTVPARSARFRSRDILAIEAKGRVEACVGDIYAGMALFSITRGQFAMLDVIQHCLTQMGPSRVTLWTWCIADYEFATFEWLLRSGAISSALLIIDRSGEQQVSKARSFRDGSLEKGEGHSALMRRWQDKFGPESIKVCMCHAKMATVSNEEFKIVIRGSMNLNHNPRFEQFDLSEGGGVFELVRQTEEALPILKAHYSRREVEDATGARKLFKPEDLRAFRPAVPLKIWRK